MVHVIRIGISLRTVRPALRWDGPCRDCLIPLAKSTRDRCLINRVAYCLSNALILKDGILEIEGDPAPVHVIPMQGLQPRLSLQLGNRIRTRRSNKVNLATVQLSA